MKKAALSFATLALVCAFAAASQAQTSAPDSTARHNRRIYEEMMVPATIVTINYQHHMGRTQIGFQGSPNSPDATGYAKVNGKAGRIQINAVFSKLDPATKFGADYLTYVLWAITPEGKANNLGEILLNSDGMMKTTVTTSLQTFGLIVTAEPYFAVSEPSDIVVLQNVVTPETTGTVDQTPVKYELLGRGAYSYEASSATGATTSAPTESKHDANAPLEYFEAQNAVQIAVNAGAQEYAPDALAKAETSLTNAEDFESKHRDSKLVVQASRDAVQNAADAHHMTIEAELAEQHAAEQAAAAERVAESKEQADAAATAAQQAELQKAQAERDAAQAAAASAQAQAGQATAEAQADQDRLAKQQAQDAAAAAQAQAAQSAADAQSAQQATAAAQAAADAERAKAMAAQDAATQSEAEKQQLRAMLLEQFNKILPTTDTPQGLKVNMADVLFAFNKYDLKPTAREALSRLTGIVLGHPGLVLTIDGYTDSVGTDEYNQNLSEQRAGAVHDYVVQQGLNAASTTAQGFGKSNPIASNDTADGRQQNRRVEIIVSGEVIGTQIGELMPEQLPNSR